MSLAYAFDADFDPEKHPRGQPSNAGEFGSGGSAPAPAPAKPAEAATKPVLPTPAPDKPATSPEEVKALTSRVVPAVQDRVSGKWHIGERGEWHGLVAEKAGIVDPPFSVGYTRGWYDPLNKKFMDTQEIEDLVKHDFDASEMMTPRQIDAFQDWYADKEYQKRREMGADIYSFDDANWDPEKHPRGQPSNAGEFGPGGGGGKAAKPASPTKKSTLFQHVNAKSGNKGPIYKSKAEADAALKKYPASVQKELKLTLVDPTKSSPKPAAPAKRAPKAKPAASEAPVAKELGLSSEWKEKKPLPGMPKGELWSREDFRHGPQYVQPTFHGTTSDVVASILKDGLAPGHSGGGDDWVRAKQGSIQVLNRGISDEDQKSRAGSVYIAADPRMAASFANMVAQTHKGAKPVVLAVQIPAAERFNIVQDEAFGDEPAFRFHGTIKPEWIHAIEVPDGGEFPGVGMTHVALDAASEDDLTLYLVPMVDHAEGIAQDFSFDADFDPGKHPRGQPNNAGEFGPGGGGKTAPAASGKAAPAASGSAPAAKPNAPATSGPAPKEKAPETALPASALPAHVPMHGYSPQATMDKDGVIHTDNVQDAIRAMYEKHKVELNQPREVSTMLDQLQKVAQHMKHLGSKAPNFDLCLVSVHNTNLFCAASKGIKRVDMPQIPADKNQAFADWLRAKGVKVEDGFEDPAYLRATQRELVGAKVAAIMTSMKADGLKFGPNDKLFVSKDNYIVDGHHRWAAMVGVSAGGTDVKIPIRRVDMGIMDLLDATEKFTGGAGHVGVGASEFKA